MEDYIIHLGRGYFVQLGDYDAWGKDVMTLIRFKQILSDFHPEVGISFCGYNFHQLRYIIYILNDKPKIIFFLGDNGSFDEEGNVMRSRYYPVKMYNKSKTDKYRVGFFILVDAKYYFIYHIDVYQGKNTENIYIHP